MVKKYFFKPFCLAACICAFVFYSGIVRIPQRYPFVSLFNCEDVTGVSGRIKSSPVKNQAGFYACDFLVDCVFSGRNYCEGSGCVVLYIPSELAEVYFPGKLYSLGQNKGFFLYEQGCNYRFDGEFYGNVFIVKECLEGAWADSLSGRLFYFRALCRLVFKRLMYSWGEAGGLLLALLCGAREYTDKATADAFRNAGLSHVLALSGMHLSLFSGIAVFLGNRFGRKKLSIALRVFFLVLFVWFAGISPSLCRAFICNFLLLFASIANVEQPDMFVVLCTSFLIQSAIRPGDINNSGFILSYSALAGILVLQNIIYRVVSRVIPKYFSNSISASTGAQFFTAPVSLKMYGAFYPGGIIASVFVSPVITVFIYSALALILLCLIFPSLAVPSGIFMNILYTIIKKMVLLFEKIPSINIK